ncbi:carbonic anhydrase [Corynebacterium uberis]|uniref:carbonic anhydrase n=1 Tax=Corynebacterium TaxID=1716 RepID=UPI001D0A8051|nr:MULTISPECIES: carbonic anhydrase [Corynebacterium]MCZ9309786.1 carbonic anhydrase [Corynebacterium sp. c6VSa_13]UDL73587.1 carbonic anhydrase [Corynebacterium uberis]UDL75533.1 carbonic anhydrase [Corynebacterium uberis]UDL77746.1 carbonic anhydrase [Corynebacterium uberis]UDL80030.1 carbonic anhydrase [Corynebacterium uberis]
MSAIDSPTTVWRDLLAGNARFVDNRPEHPNTDNSRRDALTGGQHPRAVVLACSDSRAPVELVFDVGFGDVFVIRTAGEIIDPAVLASLEYAITGLEVALVVVLGHEGCGAVSAALETIEHGQVPRDWQRVLVEKVSSSVLAGIRAGYTDTEDLERIHVEQTVNQLFYRLPGLEEEVDAGRVGVVGARYHLGSGSIETVATFGVDEDTPAR